MTAPPPRTVTDTEILSALDFEPTLPCGHSQHATRHADQPASWWAHARCPKCGHEATYPICDSGRRDFLAADFVQDGRGCGAVYENPADVFVFTPLFGGGK